MHVMNVGFNLGTSVHLLIYMFHYGNLLNTYSAEISLKSLNEISYFPGQFYDLTYVHIHLPMNKKDHLLPIN